MTIWVSTQTITLEREMTDLSDLRWNDTWKVSNWDLWDQNTSKECQDFQNVVKTEDKNSIFVEIGSTHNEVCRTSKKNALRHWDGDVHSHISFSSIFLKGTGKRNAASDRRSGCRWTQDGINKHIISTVPEFAGKIMLLIEEWPGVSWYHNTNCRILLL